jgi:plastocyanin
VIRFGQTAEGIIVMARYTGLGAALLALLAAGALAGCGPEEDAQGAPGTSYSVPLGRESSTKETVTVRMRDFGYAPRRVRIHAGDSVRWTDDDHAPHTATAEQHAAGRFETGRVRSGHSSPVEFRKPGRYPYYCRFHPFMVGTVEVVH